MIGALTADGRLDIHIMKQLMDVGKGMTVTCHRCFDMIKDQKDGLNLLIELGVDCVLTSGGKNNAIEGLENFQTLCEIADGHIDIMPGAGINTSNFDIIKKKILPKFMHLSAKEILPSRMTFKNEHLVMGQTSIDEYSILRTNEKMLKDIVMMDVTFNH